MGYYHLHKKMNQHYYLHERMSLFCQFHEGKIIQTLFRYKYNLARKLKKENKNNNLLPQPINHLWQAYSSIHSKNKRNSHQLNHLSI